MTTAFVTPAQLASVLTLRKSASTDSVTPAIGVIRVEIDDAARTLTAVSTDRYRVTRLVLPLQGDDTATGGVFFFHPSELETVVKAAGKDYLNAPLIKVHSPLEAEMGVTLELIHTGTSFMAAPYRANFPPVERLMDGERPDDLPSGIALKGSFLAALKELRFPGETPRKAADAAWKLSTKATANGKPGPVMFQRESGKSTLEYFLQPNLLLS